MKFLFLCGSLEPGRDGVGDYVRQLAGELLRKGHEAVGISLNDQYVTQEDFISPVLAKEELLLLRLPANWPATRRFQRAHQWVEEFQPDWISLQFVPHAFHSKGLPFFLGKYLRRLTQGWPVHLMMHEAWVGSEPGTDLKRLLISMLQEALIIRMIKRIEPAVIHTHLPLYSERLARRGWRVLPLPLFSNIPVAQQALKREASTLFRVGIFSQVDTGSDFLAFIASLAAHVASQRPFQVLLIGGAASRMQQLQTTLESIASLRGSVHYTGFLAPAQVSEALQSCHLGITGVPRHALGKSGSVAAFLAHGIPVAAPLVHPDYPADDIGFFSPDLCVAILLTPTIDSFEAAQAAARVAQPLIRLSSIAQTFLVDLTRQ